MPRQLLDCGDTAALDPAFQPVPADEIGALIARSQAAAAGDAREFQMQVIRLAASGQAVGCRHVMVVPARPAAVGVPILLIRPPWRRQGLGRELVAGACPLLPAIRREFRARVYLANPCAAAARAIC